MEEVHEKHRGVHGAEISALLLAAGDELPKQDAAKVRKQHTAYICEQIGSKEVHC